MKIKCIMSGIDHKTYNGTYYSKECLENAFSKINGKVPIVLECGKIIGFGKPELKYPEIHVDGETTAEGDQIVEQLVGNGGITINGVGGKDTQGNVTEYFLHSLLATSRPSISCSIELVSE